MDVFNKKKIMNDPVYGLINYPASKVFDIVEHPWFQRLRRIKQLGLTELVYPGARHTRFHHAIGATHLMSLAVDVLRAKGNEITTEEAEGAYLAILLHDIGHGPFSHALERHIVNVSHENISLIFMKHMNSEFNGALDIAIQIFTDKYPKRFLHQLVSSQLDVDRLDYLRRDSFYTGVSEGVVSSDRIIKMLDVDNDRLVIEKKGIYSVEKFLIARRLMYWQVYLHKTAHAAEQTLLSIFKRAKYLAVNGKELFASPALKYFLYNQPTIGDFNSGDKTINNRTVLQEFAMLDDNDMISAFKEWMSCDDTILAKLCEMVIDRKLFRNLIQDKPFDTAKVQHLKEKTATLYNISLADAEYFVMTNTIENNTYKQTDDKIFIKSRDGSVNEIINETDMLNIRALSEPISKYYLCFPKEVM